MLNSKKVWLGRIIGDELGWERAFIGRVIQPYFTIKPALSLQIIIFFKALLGSCLGWLCDRLTNGGKVLSIPSGPSICWSWAPDPYQSVFAQTTI